ncbi:MAG: hypothetical protein AAFZ63_16245 [Bacteroidota bacterium]
MKRLSIFTLLLSFLTVQGISQDLDINVLSDHTYETADDYAEVQDEILQCISWLKSNPVDHPDRKAVNALVLTWLTGTPSVSITLNGYVVEFTEKNPDLLILFMGGWTEHVLEVGKGNASELESNLKGVEVVIAYYENRKTNGLAKDAGMQRLIKLRDRGELTDYLKGQL